MQSTALESSYFIDNKDCVNVNITSNIKNINRRNYQMKNKELSSNQKVALNLIASMVSYVVTLGISFFLSPYIVENVGVEAYGFVSLANSFISYASLITIAVNALAGRFITIKIKQNDYETANKYYSSVFIANSLISLVLFIAGFIIVVFLEKIVNIPVGIIMDVKVLFSALFLNCILSTSGSVFSVSIFANNKLYLGSIRSIEASIIRAVVLIILFVSFPAKVSYLGITSLFMGVYSLGFNLYYTKKLSPYLKIRKKYFDFRAIKELVSSGVWNLVTRLGQIFNDELDLLITNLFIDATSMGVLSLAKTVPGIISGIVGSMVSSFSPNFTILFAEGKLDELKQSLKQSMKIMGVACNLPIIVLIVCGEKFFACWQPTQDAKTLQILSVLTCAGFIVNGGINCIYNIFTVVNKLRTNSLVILAGSVISITTTYCLLKTTSLGVFAVAGVSTVISIIRNLFFTVPYGAKCLNLKWYTFYPDVIRPVIFVLISSLANIHIVNYISGSGWFNLILCSAITVAISSVFGLFIILNKKDREFLVSKLKKKQ